MRKLKDEFNFNFKNQEIQVKLIGETHCAIFGKTAKPLKIKFHKEEETHNGRICTWEDKFLSWLPDLAIEEVEPSDTLRTIYNLLSKLDL